MLWGNVERIQNRISPHAGTVVSVAMGQIRIKRVTRGKKGGTQLSAICEKDDEWHHGVLSCRLFVVLSKLSGKITARCENP